MDGMAARVERRLRRWSSRGALQLLFVGLATGSATPCPSGLPGPTGSNDRPWVLYAVGDSLSHGTMDATNNWVSSSNGYVERVAQSLRSVVPLHFVQPFFDFGEQRICPLTVPTNFAVDGADVFTIDGLEYFKRVGAAQSYVSTDYLADSFLLTFDDYDRVLHPINLIAWKPTSQISAAEVSFAYDAASWFPRNEALIYWIGSNDVSLATLGTGGANPTFVSIPFDESRSKLSPLLVAVIDLALELGAVSFEPYSEASIDRNMTDVRDFEAQVASTLVRLVDAPRKPGTRREIFVLTLPYYTSVGYLIDSEDIEFYLRKLDPGYSVPPTFQRVAPDGEPIVDPLRGDRISLLTFGFMYAHLSTGASVADVNRILEQDGLQQDGLVLSEAELVRISGRVDEYNAILRAYAAALGEDVHLVDVGTYLNQGLAGEHPILVGTQPLSRKWVRGGALSLDGVHPNHVGHAVIANFVLAGMNDALGLAAPLHDVLRIRAADPYVDRDGDGFATGPRLPASGVAELLYLLSDPDDRNAAAQPVLTNAAWDLISNVLLGRLLSAAAVRAEAQRRGLAIGR